MMFESFRHRSLSRLLEEVDMIKEFLGIEFTEIVTADKEETWLIMTKDGKDLLRRKIE